MNLLEQKMQTHHLTPSTIFLFLFSLTIIILLFPKPTVGRTCSPNSCNRRTRESIQFPFWVPRTRNETTRCGYPGFELSCTDNQTILTLPSKTSTPFVVFAIDYADQLIWLTDQNGCIPNRVLDLNLTGSPYISGPATTQYSFLNCSNRNPVTDPDQLPKGTSVISCLSGPNYTVVSTFETESKEKMEKEWKCEVVKTVEAPLWWPEFGYGYYPADMSNVFMQLSWEDPNCGDCALRGGSCGFLHDSGLEVGCFLDNKTGGLPRMTEVGLIFGVGVPGLICMMALVFYISNKLRAHNNNNNSNQSHQTNLDSSTPAVVPVPESMIITLGLDRHTIESYPKTVLGESKRLPKPSDGICPICLSEYQPKDTLRSIPECNHYFHAECIDEWLRINATCPICRSLPHISSTTVVGS